MPAGKFLQPLWFQRPDTAHLVNRNTQLLSFLGVNAQQAQRLDHVLVGFARGHDSQLALTAVMGDFVDVVGAHKFVDQRQTVASDQNFIQLRGVLPRSIVHTLIRKYAIGGNHGGKSIDIQIYRAGLLHGFVDHLEPNPQAAVAGHRPSQQAKVDSFLHVGRVQGGDGIGGESVFALVGNGGRFARVVVAVNGQHTAVAVGAKIVTVFEGVATAIDAGTFAVPDCEHTIDSGVWNRVQLLGADHRGGRQVFVDARLEEDVMGCELGLFLPQGTVVASQWRAPVAADKTRGIEAGAPVQLALDHRQPHQGLVAGDKDPPLASGVLVVEIQFSQGHGLVPVTRDGFAAIGKTSLAHDAGSSR